jgi:TolB-like protein
MVTFLLIALLLGRCENCEKDAMGAIKTAVFELSAIGVQQELATTISDLLRLELTECERYAVIGKGTMTETLGEDLVAVGMSEAVMYSDSLGASLAVIGQITVLGRKTIISVSLINKWTKETLFTDKFTSGSLEDIEIVIKRLADALCEMKKAKTSVTVETVTEEEARPRRRRSSYHTGGVMLGYLFPTFGTYGREVEGDYWDDDLSLGNVIISMPGFSIQYLYEMPHHMAEMCGRMHWKSRSFSMAVEFGGYRFLSLEDVAPFVGGGVGMSWGRMPDYIETTFHDYGDYSYTNTEVHMKSFNGLSLTAGGGLALFRTYDFHFLLSLKYNIVLTDGCPNGFLFSFGVTYKGGGGSCIGI